MLQKLNERIQGVVAWVIIILVSLTFTLFGVDYFLQSRHSSDAKAKVNGQEISKQDFDLHFRRNAQLQDISQLNTSNEAHLKQQVLNDMIVNSLSVQAANNNGFSVSKNQVNTSIVSIPQFQEKGRFSQMRYTQALSGALYTPDSFQQEVKQGMLINQQRFALIGTEFALPVELKQFIKLYMQKRDYSYLTIPLEQFTSQVKVSDAEINSFYKKHQKEYLSPEMVSIDYVRVSMDEIKRNIKLSEEQLVQYYEDNKNNYLMPMQWRVAHILLKPSDSTFQSLEAVKEQANKLSEHLRESPGEFSDNIKLVSADKSSVDGVLPWIVAGNSEYDKHLLNFTIPNQVSKPIKLGSGYEILKLIEYKPATIKPFAEVKDLIKEQMQIELTQRKYTELLEKLADLSYQTPDSLDMVGKLLDLSVEHSSLFNKDGGDTEITKNSKIIKAAFSEEVLESGNNSEPVQLNNDSVLVLRVNKHIPSVVKELADVRPLIVEKIKVKKSKLLAKEYGQKVMSNQKALSRRDIVKNGSNLLSWQKVTQVGRDVNTVDPSINELAFELSSSGDKYGSSLPNGDFVIVYLEQIHPGSIDSLDKEQISSLTQQIESSYGLMDYNLYINGLMEQAKIVKN
ncbi:MAG: SurA N-terminal domain-containing protein [Legionellaceae bacterium]|nr:SurA N-terminal domain-containing protein [Legionellaceae bacterium]